MGLRHFREQKVLQTSEVQKAQVGPDEADI